MELAAGYAEDVTDLRAILRLIKSGALDEAAGAIDCLDTLVRDQLPQRHCDAVPAVDGLDALAQPTRSLRLQIGDIPRIGR